MTTFAAASTDSQTWVVTGVRNCDIYGCSHDAAIIGDTCNYARFCLTHADEAIGIALRDPKFNGWYRITAGHYDDTRHCLIVTVHPL